MAKKLLPPKCLVISKNGEGEGLKEVLAQWGFSFIPAGNGCEGSTAVWRYAPKLIVIFLCPDDEDDIMALRAVQAASVKAAIVSTDVPRVVHLLGPKKARQQAPHLKVLDSSTFNQDQLRLALGL